MAPDLTTTNALLGIMAAVSVIEGLAVAGLLLGGFLLYRRVGRLLGEVEARHVAPAAARVNAILDDVKGVTWVAKHAVEGADERLRSGVAWVLRYFRTRGRAA